MEQAKLLVHRGATRVTREQLAQYEPPEATVTWKPIKHADVVDCLYEELGRREISITHEEYAVQRKGNYLFGVMTLNYLKTDEFAAALAFRHSNDMQEAMKMYAGVRVFACDNMALSGSELILHKSLFSIFSPTPFRAILATKRSDLLDVGTATPRRSSRFSLKISQNGSGKKILNRL